MLAGASPLAMPCGLPELWGQLGQEALLLQLRPHQRILVLQRCILVLEHLHLLLEQLKVHVSPLHLLQPLHQLLILQSQLRYVVTRLGQDATFALWRRNQVETSLGHFIFSDLWKSI